MPDDVERPAPLTKGKPRPVDFYDEFAAFAREMPAWCNRRGMPKSWAHYVVGSAVIAREKAREAMRMAGATGVTQANEQHARKWWRDTERAAGL